MLDDGAKMPQRAHRADAGLDLFSMDDKLVPAKGSAIFNTGFHIEIPIGWMGLVASKSGLNFKYGLTSEGIVDSGYTNSIMVKLYNNSDTDYWVKKGDKISQLILVPIMFPDLEVVDHFEETERGNNGFGSTGK